MSPALRALRARLDSRRAPLVVAVLATLTACASVTVAATGAVSSAPSPAPARATRDVAVGSSASDTQVAAPTRPAAAAPAPAVAPLGERVKPDVLVTSPTPLGADRLAALAASGRTVVLRAGTVTVAGRPAQVLAGDPSALRAFTAQPTAEADAVWAAAARGEVIASHAFATGAGLQLGAPVDVVPASGGAALPLRLGAMATTGVPRSDLVVDDATGGRLGLPPATAVLLSAPPGSDPSLLGAAVQKAAGTGAQVELLAPAASDPVAFLTGSRAAEAFGSFSYRYYPDGTIEPDAAWVKANIIDATVPILGRVRCHRLMVPQLRGALQEVQDAGLASLLHTYDGCFVPKFIPDTNKAVSLHAWGIAVDMDASTNYRGIRGTMDSRIVAIFKKWGFRWGGDWHYTDPMHFELGALLVDPPRK